MAGPGAMAFKRAFWDGLGADDRCRRAMDAIAGTALLPQSAVRDAFTGFLGLRSAARGGLSLAKAD